MPQFIELKNLEGELAEFRRRTAFAAGFVLLLFGVLFGRFVYLQVMNHEYYYTQAEANRISLVPIVPNRGLIVDRNGIVLAHNFTAYTLEINPTQVGDLEATIDALSQLIEIAPKDRRRFKRLLDESRQLAAIPIRTRLSEDEIARFAANRYRFPGVDINARLFRRYPNGTLASHVVGYIGRINPKDMETLEENSLLSNYRGSEHIGKTGLEQMYERELHGTTGLEQVEVDSGGRAVRTLSRTPPVSGNNLQLHLDLRLQEAAEAAFGNRRGALVAIDPATGGVLAFVSKPGFDPNLFIDGIDPPTWNELNTHPDRPMVNRALSGQYPPGSTYKPFMALAGLELGKRTPQYSISDPGFFTLPGNSHHYRDWKPGGHGSVDMHRSLVISCDTYYYQLAFDLGIDAISTFMRQFGFGARTGLDLEGEAIGINPSQEWKQRRFRQKWYVGDTISIGIGQGYNVMSLMQLANATAIIANKGVVYRPHLVDQIQDATTRERRAVHAEALRTLDFKPENWALVQRAMVDVNMPGGTGHRAFADATYRVGGKTGTSQVIAIKQGQRYDAKRIDERHRDHALYIAYAPADNPKIALAVLVENAGGGGANAAPLARTVIDFYLLGRPIKPIDAEPIPGTAAAGEANAERD
ncbi:MAG: penicillin-binding protein 2 [Proteobacteria bacterium]|nr:penicillin-binding protein 2 [Burkholderiales bacterium]